MMGEMKGKGEQSEEMEETERGREREGGAVLKSNGSSE